jgi:hypothetical protein
MRQKEKQKNLMDQSMDANFLKDLKLRSYSHMHAAKFNATGVVGKVSAMTSYDNIASSSSLLFLSAAAVVTTMAMPAFF